MLLRCEGVLAWKPRTVEVEEEGEEVNVKLSNKEKGVRYWTYLRRYA